jgi:Tol biopolymer transport system component
MNDASERLLMSWLAEGPARGPEEGLARVLATTRRTRQRPAWRFAPWWFRTSSFGQEAPRRQMALALVVVALLLIAALAIGVVVGVRPRVPPAIGVASNGALAYAAGGKVILAGAGGAHPRPLAGSGGIDSNPTYSRDGTRFAFWSQTVADGPLALFVADADGSDARKISGSTAIDASPLYSPSWSPDGTRILFSSRDAGIERLYVVPSDGSSAPRALTDRTADRGAASWSPDGAWLAYQKLVDGTPPIESVVVARADGTGERALYSQPLPADEGIIDGPTWAPDSSAIVYARPADPVLEPDLLKHGLLAVAPLDGKERIIFEHPTQDWISWPGWSPDGAWIAFGTGDVGHPGAVHLIRPDGTDDRLVFRGPSQGGTNCWPVWSPDARSVIAVCGPFVEIPVDAPSNARSLGVPNETVELDWQRVAP